jgi:hypothetical protein
MISSRTRLLAVALAAALLAATSAQAQRIIKVPQGRDYGAASAQPTEPDYELEPGLDPIDPPPRRKAMAPRRTLGPPREAPQARTELPALPATQKRTVLHAPAEMPLPGPTPVRPTPRWRNAAPASTPIEPAGEMSRIETDPAAR